MRTLCVLFFNGDAKEKVTRGIHFSTRQVRVIRSLYLILDTFFWKGNTPTLKERDKRVAASHVKRK
jgi:hypothetical protein